MPRKKHDDEAPPDPDKEGKVPDTSGQVTQAATSLADAPALPFGVDLEDPARGPSENLPADHPRNA